MDGLDKKKDFNEDKDLDTGSSYPPAVSTKYAGAGPSQSENKGSYLKSVREQRGISLEAVHEATKIPMDALRAIEEGYKVKILSPFYMKGFIKIYANYLDVDVAQIIDDYQPEKLPKHIKSDYNDFNVVDWLAKKLTRQRRKQLLALGVILLSLFLIFRFIAFIASRPKKEKPVKVEEKIKKEELKVKPAVAPKPAETPQREPKPSVEVKPVQPPAVAPSSEANKKVTLTVRAKKKCWLRVLVDGQVVFQSTLGEGSVETWQAQKQIEIAGRNINDLDFELNGKMIGPLGRTERTANRVVITKDGLSVLK